MSAKSNPSTIVGFVCEGSTDFVVLRDITEAVLGPIEALPLQPQLDELDRQIPGGRSGWSEVRAWCQRQESLAELFDAQVGDSIDLLVISVDLDIAIQANAEKRGKKLKKYNAKNLKKLVNSWLPNKPTNKVLVIIPVMAIEAWIVAAIFPRIETSPESIENPALFLVEKNKIQMGTNGPWKRVQEYKTFSEIIVKRLKSVSEKCDQLKFFIQDLQHYSNTA